MTHHDDGLTAEQRARQLIDAQLSAAGWVVQDRGRLNLHAAQGVAVRESIMAPGHGRVDYLLYVDRAVVGVIEAKPVGATLTGVEWQSAMYASGLPAEVRLAARTVDGRPPFVIEASGTETHLTNGYDPYPRARAVFSVPQPDTLAAIVRQAEEHPDAPTWRGRVRDPARRADGRPRGGRAGGDDRDAAPAGRGLLRGAVTVSAPADVDVSMIETLRHARDAGRVVTSAAAHDLRRLAGCAYSESSSWTCRREQGRDRDDPDER